MAKFTGKLSNGFEYEIDTAVLESMRFIDALADAEEGTSSSPFSHAVKLLLGEKQREALYKHIEDGGEIVTVEMMGNIILEIFEEVPKGKN